MEFNFVKTQLKKCPNIIGWYLILDPKDDDLLLYIHKIVTQTNILKAEKDPHIKGEINKSSFLVMIQHPISLSARWLMAMENNRFNGNIALVNRSGGWMPLDDQINILQRVTKNKFEFPTDKYEDQERLTISRFPDGKHWYISSNKDRMFDKFNNVDEALVEAKRHVPYNKISIKDFPAKVIRSGD